MQEIEPEKRVGRPRGSRNRITLLKLEMEEGFRSENAAQIGRILKGILDDAENGDKDCRKLVWQAYVSKAGADQQQQVGALPTITIRTEGTAPPVKRVEVHESSAIEGEWHEVQTSGSSASDDAEVTEIPNE
jgi:hypothetical protein